MSLPTGKFISWSHLFPIGWSNLFERTQAVWDFLCRTSLEAKLVRAVKRDREDQLAKLLDDNEWDIECALTPAPLTYEQRYHRAHGGHTLLNLAVQQRKERCVKLLLERGANANTTSQWGMSPALYAAGGDDVVNLTLLELFGADMTRRLPSMSTYFDDYVGPTVLELFESTSGKTFAMAKSLWKMEAFDKIIEGRQVASEDHGRPRM